MLSDYLFLGKLFICYVSHYKFPSLPIYFKREQELPLFSYSNTIESETLLSFFLNFPFNESSFLFLGSFYQENLFLQLIVAFYYSRKIINEKINIPFLFFLYLR